MTWLWVLGLWTAVGLLWRVVGVILVATADRRRPSDLPADERTLTIFKPLPGPLDASEFERVKRGLESFAADLDHRSQLLIGCHSQDHPDLAAFVDSLVARYSTGTITLIADDDPSRLCANPKVSWCRILASHATGELWFWSDADITAPPGTLASLRSDFAQPGVGLVTSPYVIRDGFGAPEVLDQLFVNAEFYPGALLTDRLGAMNFAFGSGMLFEAENFRRNVDWEHAGSLLADDYHLGNLLRPTRLGSATLATNPASRSWMGSLLHYLRWHKTVRWVQPGGYAAQMVVLPVIGWLGWVVFEPANPVAWAGLGVVVILESLAGLISCRLVRAKIDLGRLPLLLSWPVVRGLTSLACWLPWPIDWRGQKWWGPQKVVRPGAEMVGERTSARVK